MVGILKDGSGYMNPSLVRTQNSTQSIIYRMEAQEADRNNHQILPSLRSLMREKFPLTEMAALGRTGDNESIPFGSINDNLTLSSITTIKWIEWKTTALCIEI